MAVMTDGIISNCVYFFHALDCEEWLWSLHKKGHEVVSFVP